MTLICQGEVDNRYRETLEEGREKQYKYVIVLFNDVWAQVELKSLA